MANTKTSGETKVRKNGWWRLLLLTWGLGGIFCVLGIVKLIIAIYIWLGLVDAAATGVVGTAAETPVWVGMFLGILAWIGGVIYLIQRVQRQ